AGLYLLSAYGGPARAWSEENEETETHAFYLRYGFPPRPAIGREHRTVSPLGFDRFHLPAGSSFVRIDLPESTDAVLEATPFDPRRPFARGSRATIDKNSVMPVAEITRSSNTGLVVTVTAQAGQPYVLQHFPPANQMQVFQLPRGSASDRYWVSTVHSGSPGDHSDATAVLARRWDRTPQQPQQRIERVAVSAVRVSRDRPWHRRFDIQGNTTVLLDVRTPGTYRFVSDPQARCIVEPLMTSRPPRYVSPEPKASGEEWTLGKGLHLLGIEPSARGVAEMSFESTARGATPAAEEPAEPLAASQWPSLDLDPAGTYGVMLAVRPGISSGLVVRPLPIDPLEPLPVVLKPGESIEIPIVITERGVLRATTEDGTLLPMVVDEDRPAREVRPEPGRRIVRMQNDGESTVLFSLGLEPDRTRPSAPLPKLSRALLDDRPVFPVLTPEETRFLDLDRQEQETFSVRASTPALYRLETTGLLDTEGNLRTRTITSFERSAGGGTGRNFLISRYLRQGDYQLTVSTRGRSKGRLGLRLSPSPLVDGGMLREGVAARAEVPAGEGLLYRFEVPETGNYRIETLGLGRSFRVRLEDEDAWPIVRPGVDGNMTRELEPGTYRLLLLPEPLETRRVVRVSRVETPPSFEGHGPHRLPLDRVVTNEWREPAEGEERTPDVWLFEMPGPNPVQIDLGAHMEATLWQGEEKIAEIRTVQGWSGELEAGEHRLEVRSIRPDDRRSYRLAVRPEHMVAGLTRTVAAPATLTVSVGEPGLVELSAFGSHDVKARLTGPDGELVTEQDDRPGDWSFLISRYLAPGVYRLQVDPVAEQHAHTTITMEMPRQLEGEPLSAPGQTEISPGDDVLVHPLAIEETGLLVLSASSAESFGLALEVSAQGSGWSTVASRTGRLVRVEVPLPGSGSTPDHRRMPEGRSRRSRNVEGWSYRLRVWSVDKGGNPVGLRMAVARPRALDEGDLQRGAALRPLAGIEPPLAVGKLEDGRAGALVIGEPQELDALRFTDGVHIPARSSRNGTLTRSGGAGWLILDSPSADMRSSAQVQALRARLAERERLSVSVPAGAVAAVDADEKPGMCRIFSRRKHAPFVVRAHAETGRPALAVGPAGEEPRRAALASTSPSSSGSVAVSLYGNERAVHVWNAEPGGSRRPLEARISYTHITPTDAQPARPGAHQGVVEA
ncbi:MAG: hypothetical protein ACOCVR_02040, partial [Myxococcota bacterium]